VKKETLLSLKDVLRELGVSRATFWRAQNSGIEGFPKPTKRGGAMFWRQSQLPALDLAMDGYQGRNAFEARRKRQKTSAAGLHDTLVRMKRAQRGRRRGTEKQRPDGQRDFFS
jgi:predicted DNA-binding transcriptional regulator AlpA